MNLNPSGLYAMTVLEFWGTHLACCMSDPFPLRSYRE